MTADLLESISLFLPQVDADFHDALLELFALIGQRTESGMEFTSTMPSSHPRVSLNFQPINEPVARFVTHSSSIDVALVNDSGCSVESPHKYSPIPLQHVIDRLAGRPIVSLDHVGFNLAWFDGEHPRMRRVREQISGGSAYFRFPTGELWDFILPATSDEITNQADIDLNMVRRPKFELVTMDHVSTPIIQFDIGVDSSFEEIIRLFPEGIRDDSLKNVWVYVENPYQIDLCLVIGAADPGDWSSFFAGNRVGTIVSAGD